MNLSINMQTASMNQFSPKTQIASLEVPEAALELLCLVCGCLALLSLSSTDCWSGTEPFRALQGFLGQSQQSYCWSS